MRITSRSLLALLALAALLPAAAAFSAPAVHVPRALSTAAAQPLLPARPVALRITQPPLAVATTPPELEEKQLDTGSLGRYIFAVLIQMILVTVSFGFVDLYCYGPIPFGEDLALGGPLPWQAVVAIFIGMSLRSRLFSPLDNSRPELRVGSTDEEDEVLKGRLEELSKIKKSELSRECAKRGIATDSTTDTMDREEYAERLNTYFARKALGGRPGEGEDRKMPGWTPPGVVFPLMWVGVVAPLRAFASSMVYEASTGRLNAGHLNDPVLLWLVFHLCLGDTWNCVNNVERRTGAAVPGVTLVWLSTLYAAKQYYDIVPLAGILLGISAVWITVAGALVADTWRINNEIEPEPLYPYKSPGMRSITRLSFEE